MIPVSFYNPYTRARPLYLYDAEARNIEQLKNFAKREMAQLQKRSLSVSYEFDGHSQDGTVFAIDTLIDVEDEIGGVFGPMWVESVTFTKSRSAGTRTHLTLILPHTMTL